MKTAISLTSLSYIQFVYNKIRFGVIIENHWQLYRMVVPIGDIHHVAPLLAQYSKISETTFKSWKEF